MSTGDSPPYIYLPLNSLVSLPIGFQEICLGFLKIMIVLKGKAEYLLIVKFSSSLNYIVQVVHKATKHWGKVHILSPLQLSHNLLKFGKIWFSGHEMM